MRSVTNLLLTLQGKKESEKKEKKKKKKIRCERKEKAWKKKKRSVDVLNVLWMFLSLPQHIPNTGLKGWVKGETNRGSLLALVVRSAPLMSTSDIILWGECLSALPALFGVTCIVFSVISVMTISKSCR
jgi:hypothetical protein